MGPCYIHRPLRGLLCQLYSRLLAQRGVVSNLMSAAALCTTVLQQLQLLTMRLVVRPSQKSNTPAQTKLLPVQIRMVMSLKWQYRAQL